jgi:3-carboxy-cis,cis-muconate cycloisomerase
LSGDQLFAPIFTSDELIAATGDRAWLQALLDAEAALAGAQADWHVIPADAADAIADACQVDRFDPTRLGRAGRQGGNPVIPLVGALRAEVPGWAEGWVHWGATSQDILDSGAMLVAQRASGLIDGELTRLAAACAARCRSHRDTLMVGRTLLQPALPITFGLKAAGWLSGVLAARRQLHDARGGLAAQLGGATGTLASLGPDGPAVVAAYARRLGLSEPRLPWHTARQQIGVLAGALGLVAGTAAKIAGDVVHMAQSEVNEAQEHDAGGSSAMPHKRNPAASVVAIAAARRAHALLPVLFSALLAEHERAAGAWHAEWQPLSELLALAGGAASRVADVVEGLDLSRAAMAANLNQQGGTILSERVILVVTAMTGDRAGASAAVERAARSGPEAFPGALAADPVIGSVLDRSRIDELLDPAGYLGATHTWIERALADYAAEADRRRRL